MVRSLLAGVGLLSIVAIGAVSVQAYDRYDRDLDRMRVPTAGLDLTTRDGQALLHARIDSAVRKLCDYRGSGSVLSSYGAKRKCRAHAYASTRVQVASAIDAAWQNKRTAMRRDRRWAREDAPAYTQASPTPRGYAAGGDYLCRDGSGRQVTCANAYGERSFAPPADLREPVPYDREAREPERYAEVQRYPAPEYGSARRPRPDVPAYTRREPRTDELDAELAGQPAGIRDAVAQALELAFQRDDAASWRSWNARGYVTVSDPRWVRGTACRNVAVVRAILGGYETIATGLRCWAPQTGFIDNWS